MTMKVDLVGQPMTESRCYIFCQQYLQRGNLKQLEWPDYQERLAEIYGFFKDEIKFDHVEECKDFSKEQVKQKFIEIQKISDAFEKDSKNGN